MRVAGILALTLLMLAACAPEENTDTPQTLAESRGKTIIFQSNVSPAVVALHLDEGSYLNYADISKVGGDSDIGDTLVPCGEGLAECVEVGGAYIMVPPPGKAAWSFGSYNFRVIEGAADREGHAIVVSRFGEESYSYNYSPRCGVGWINFSAGGEEGEEVFYPVGGTLFSGTACAAVTEGLKASVE